MNALAIFGFPGGMEWIVVGVVALLIFGRRLPDVARSVGKSIVEFKKGLREVKDEMDVPPRIEPPRERRLESNVTGNEADPAGAAEASNSDRAAADTPSSAEAPAESDG